MKKSKIHMKPALPIETDRLLLRKYKDTDVKDIIEYSADLVIAEDVDWEPTEDGIKKFMAKQRDVNPDEDPKWLGLAIELKEEGKVIGTIGIGVLSREHKQGIVGWALGVAYQRHGYATEAARAILEFGFKSLKFHRIIAKSDAKNTRSWLLMERIGMRREAYFRHSKFQKKEWRDKLVYAILSDEWNTP
jgi:RimJ/RimL family protein N-acetyltransferase